MALRHVLVSQVQLVIYFYKKAILYLLTLFEKPSFRRPDGEVVASVASMLSDEKASDKVLLSISSILHTYNVWSSGNEGKEEAIAAINYLEITLNETLIRGENPDKVR